MQTLDWIVLILTLLTIVLYGTWKTRGSKNTDLRNETVDCGKKRNEE